MPIVAFSYRTTTRTWSFDDGGKDCAVVDCAPSPTRSSQQRRSHGTEDRHSTDHTLARRSLQQQQRDRVQVPDSKCARASAEGSRIPTLTIQSRTATVPESERLEGRVIGIRGAYAGTDTSRC